MIDNEIVTLIENNSKIKVNRNLSYLITYGFNNVYLIQDSNIKYVLRLSDVNKPVVTTEEDYLFELDLLQYLNDNKLPVVQPLKWNNNRFLLKKTMNNVTFYCCLFNFAEGKPLESTGVHKYFIFGKFIGELHKQMALFQSKYKRYAWNFEKSLDFPIKQFKEILSFDLPDEYCELFSLKDWLKEKLGLFSNLIHYGLVHGDVQNYNVHFLDDDTFTMYDFDFMGYNYLAFDIACMIGSENVVFNFNKDNEIPESLSNAQKEFIKGYQIIRKLTKDEIRILPLLEIQRIIMVFGGWAGLVYTQGDDKMEDDETITVREYFIKRIKFILPRLQVIKSKWINNDLFYYNDIFNL